MYVKRSSQKGPGIPGNIMASTGLNIPVLIAEDKS